LSFEVTILGCSSATPTADRHPSAQILNINGHYILIDCGEATQNQLLKYRLRHSKISHIFISHLHGDHYLGLVGLLATINFQGRETELHLYGPPALEAIINDHFKYSFTVLKFPLHFHPVHDDESRPLEENNIFKVKSVVLRHRLPTTGFVFEEVNPNRKINNAACELHEVPYTYYDDLKRGLDYRDDLGNVIENKLLTFEPKAPRKYAYCSDTCYFEPVLEHIDGADMLYHESTFLHELEDRARETFHSTALQAATIAQKAKVGKLLLGHFSARYRDLTPLLDEARSVFENSFLAIEGQKFTID
jgi:ribonuclease Z